MGQLQLEEVLTVTVAKDKMLAQIDVKEGQDLSNVQLTDESLRQLLTQHHIKYGIMDEAITHFIQRPTMDLFPLTIARGKQPEHGKDGKVEYVSDFSTEINRDQQWNFRDVMRIPSVKKGEKIATLKPPTKGTPGYMVNGKMIAARPGRPALIKAGKNVVFNEENQTFYAVSEGQLSIRGKLIQIQPVIEIHETLSMKKGNLDFVGTIIIRGDVPAGYSVKAGGDIKIFGMVEAATISAGGSVHVSEGLAGQGKGTIESGESIQIGYINQGNVIADKDLYVENSIIHSICTIKGHVFCQKGSIIGGTLSVGKMAEAKDVGNRLSTKTEIIFGLNQLVEQQKNKLLTKKQDLEAMLAKLTLLGEKLKANKKTDDPKLRITALRQKHSWSKTKAEMEKVEQAVNELNSYLGSEQEAELIVRNYLYSNVTVAFGKYRRVIKADHHYVKMNLVDNEIVIHPLSSM